MARRRKEKDARKVQDSDTPLSRLTNRVLKKRGKRLVLQAGLENKEDSILKGTEFEGTISVSSSYWDERWNDSFDKKAAANEDLNFIFLNPTYWNERLTDGTWIPYVEWEFEIVLFHEMLHLAGLNHGEEAARKAIEYINLVQATIKISSRFDKETINEFFAEARAFEWDIQVEDCAPPEDAPFMDEEGRRKLMELAGV